MITEPTLLRINEAVQLSHGGERDAARLLFAETRLGGTSGRRRPRSVRSAMTSTGS